MSYGYHWHHIQLFCDRYNKCISTTVHRGSIMTTVNRRSVMVYGCLQVNLWEPSGKLRSIVIIRHVLSDGIYTFKYLKSDELFYILSTEGIRLLKLLLQLHHQFLHEGKTDRCNIQSTSRLKLKGSEPTYIADIANMKSTICNIVISRTSNRPFVNDIYKSLNQINEITFEIRP